MNTTASPPRVASTSGQRTTLAIIGAGAMGSCLASTLDPQATVALVCRNADRAAELIRDGVRSVGNIEAIGTPLVVRTIVDLVRLAPIRALFVATKTSTIPALAAELRPMLPALGDPMVVSFQNGIEPGRQLIELLDTPRVLRMVINIGATLDPETGQVEVTMTHPPNLIGYLDAAYRAEAEWLAGTLTAGGFETAPADDIEAAIWRKGIMNAAMNPVCALVNGTIGDVLDAPARHIVTRLLDEAIAVADAEGTDLGDGYLSQVIAVLESARAHTPSMVHDIRRGRESEVGQLNRQIIEHARGLAVAVPTHEVIDALIETFDFRTYRHGCSGANNSAGPQHTL